LTGNRSARDPDPVVAGDDGNAVLGPWMISYRSQAGEATLELTVTQTDGTVTVITHPYILK
jgi:hypothetical protein